MQSPSGRSNVAVLAMVCALLTGCPDRDVEPFRAEVAKLMHERRYDEALKKLEAASRMPIAKRAPDLFLGTPEKPAKLTLLRERVARRDTTIRGTVTEVRRRLEVPPTERVYVPLLESLVALYSNLELATSPLMAEVRAAETEVCETRERDANALAEALLSEATAHVDDSQHERAMEVLARWPRKFRPTKANARVEAKRSEITSPDRHRLSSRVSLLSGLLREVHVLKGEGRGDDLLKAWREVQELAREIAGRSYPLELKGEVARLHRTIAETRTAIAADLIEQYTRDSEELIEQMRSAAAESDTKSVQRLWERLQENCREIVATDPGCEEQTNKLLQQGREHVD
ncbi:hypothetical protein ACFL59_04815 [Planctomycetota bacterium]